MLNAIKDMISAKKSYLESAQIILENDELDDEITLDQPAAEPEEKKPVEDHEVEEPAEVPEETKDEPATDPTEDNIDEPNDDLPEPVGAQTNEPISDDSVNLLDVEINISTNTMDDVLPVPPANAQDAVPSDVMDQQIDAGFGGGEPEDEPEAPVADTSNMMDDPIDQPAANARELENNVDHDLMNDDIDAPVEESTAMTEAISIGDEPIPDDSTDAPSEEPAAPDAAQESPVTTAVKDKVEEADTPLEDPIEEPATEEPTEDEGKKAIMNKLSSLTKSLEDVKAMMLK